MRIGKAALLKKRLIASSWGFWRRLKLWSPVPQRTMGGRGFRRLRCPHRSVRSWYLTLQDRDERQVAMALGIVEPVADDEAIGDLEADVAGRKVHLAPLGLGQQRAHLERARIARAEVAHQVLQGQARIDDVLDDQHVAVFDR